MSPREIVSLIDFRYITDAVTPEEALEILTRAEEGKKERLQEALESRAVPAYTTSAGWLGYGQDKMRGLLRETLSKGYKHFKLKVGGNLEQDKERLSIAREIIGFDKGNVLMVDANQVWSVPEAIEYMKELKEFKPWFIEEPTSPDDGMMALFSLSRVWGSENANTILQCSATKLFARPSNRTILASPRAKCARTASCSSNSWPLVQSTYVKLMPAVSAV